MNTPIVPQLQSPEYLIWEAGQGTRHELHRGFVLEFACGTVRYNVIANNTRTLLRSIFGPLCVVFDSDMKLRVTSDTIYYPDATVVCEAVAEDATVLESARVVVEVLSASTRHYDMVEKRAAYRSMPSLEALVLVDSEMRRVEVDERRDGRWNTATFDGEEAILRGRPVRVDALYADTSLAATP